MPQLEDDLQSALGESVGAFSDYFTDNFARLMEVGDEHVENLMALKNDLLEPLIETRFGLEEKLSDSAHGYDKSHLYDTTKLINDAEAAFEEAANAVREELEEASKFALTPQQLKNAIDGKLAHMRKQIVESAGV